MSNIDTSVSVQFEDTDFCDPMEIRKVTVNDQFFSFGPLNIRVVQNHLLMAQIGKEFSPLGAESDHIDLEIRFLPPELLKNYAWEYQSGGSAMTFNETTFFIGNNFHYNYLMEKLFHSDEKCIIYLTNDKSHTIKSILRLMSFFLRPGYDRNILMERNALMSYSLIWYVVSVLLLRKKCCFIHSSIFSIDQKATVIAGTGGCGKTSLLFKILENREFKYVAEDFGVVSGDGAAIYSPKNISMYASDYDWGSKTAIDFVSNKLPHLFRFRWNIARKFFKQDPLIKVPPHIFIGKDRIETSAHVHSVLYMVRRNIPKVTIDKVGTEELIDRVINSSFRELKTLLEILKQMNANAPLCYEIPSEKDLIYSTKDILGKGFSKSNNYIVGIPEKNPIEDTLKSLQDYGLLL